MMKLLSCHELWKKKDKLTLKLQCKIVCKGIWETTCKIEGFAHGAALAQTRQTAKQRLEFLALG